ncbi:MAG: class F sortase [Candidatus Saccharimonadales bacterium]
MIKSALLIVLIVVIVFLALDTHSATPSPSQGSDQLSTGLGVSAMAVPPSQPVELRVPSNDSLLNITARIKPMPTHCRSIIDPPRDPENMGGIYSCNDFALPSTASSNFAVLAGHAGAGIEAWFNRLYRRGQGFVGQEALVRTKASHNSWLVYTVQAVYTPHKSQLPYMQEVWGGDTAGRLIMVTCDIDSDGSSPRNYVAVLQFTEVRR